MKVELGRVEQFVFENENGTMRVGTIVSPAAALGTVMGLCLLLWIGWRYVGHDDGFFYAWTLVVGSMLAFSLWASVASFLRGPSPYLIIGSELVMPSPFGLTRRAARQAKIPVGLYHLPLVSPRFDVRGHIEHRRNDRQHQLLFLDASGQSSGISLEFEEAASLQQAFGILQGHLPLEVREDRRAEVYAPPPVPFGTGTDPAKAARFKAAVLSAGLATGSLILMIEFGLKSPSGIAWAKRHASNSLARFWLESGVRRRVGLPWSLFHEACFNGERELAETLLNAGRDPNALADGGRTGLYLAAQGEQAEMIAFLASRGASVDAKDSQGFTPLHHAAGKAKKVATLKALLQAGADPRARSPRGDTPLHAAARYGWVEGLEALSARGAELEARDDLGLTPLHAAAAAGRIKALELLASKGADLNAKDAKGRTPLQLVRQEPGFTKPEKRRRAEQALLRLGATE